MPKPLSVNAATMPLPMTIDVRVKGLRLMGLRVRAIGFLMVLISIIAGAKAGGEVLTDSE